MLTALLTIGALGAGFAYLAVSFALDRRRHAREGGLLHAIPRAAVRDLIDGQRVRVVGTVVSNDEFIKAPYTGRLCLAFRARTHASPLSMHDLSFSLPHDSKPSQRAIAFRVMDDSGDVEIDVEHIALELDEHLIDVEEAGKHVIVMQNATIKYWQATLTEHQRVAVIGVVRRSAAGAPRLTGTAAEPMIITTNDAALAP